MEFESNLGNIDTRKNYDPDSLASVIAKAHVGNSILFLGAGFPSGSRNSVHTDIPRAAKLSENICDLGGFERDGDLAYSADRYLRHNEPAKLIGYLKDSFTIEKVKNCHQQIANINWRRVYTTNYDNCFELAAGLHSKSITPITLESSPKRYWGNRDICVHINGSIQLLDENTIENSFKLSESSYTNSDAFTDSSWSYRFKTDLGLCSQIIFIGYSLYDMEIRRLLVSDEEINKKTFFICSENPSEKENHRLSKYGEVFAIGVDKFGEMLADTAPEELPESIEYLSSFSREEIKFDKNYNYNDSDVRDLLLRGNVKPNAVAMSITAEKNMYAVTRTESKRAISLLKEADALVIHGDIANGKSIMLNQISANLQIEGKLVYTIKDPESWYKEDIEKLSDLNRQIYLFVDDFEQHIEIIKYFTHCLNSNGKLVLAERPHRYRRLVPILKELGITYKTINIDYLHEEEIDAMVQIIEDCGFWANLGGLGNQKKHRYIVTECESQISLVLLDVLKSPDILSRFNRSFAEILKHPDTKKCVHAICLIQYLLPSFCKRSFISDIAETNHVYAPEFAERLERSGMFTFERGQLVTRSSIFCTHILKNLYNASYSIDQMVRIASKLHRLKDTQEYEHSELYRGIMKFGTLSDIFPESNIVESYNMFYDRLKRELPQVANNPHYWLQYAMAVMSAGKLADAERILLNAYGKAERYEYYDKTYIDNQFARLNLKKAIEEKEQNILMEYFLCAHRILINERSDIYKFRQAGFYIPLYEKSYALLSKGNRVKFEHALKHMAQQFDDFLSREYFEGGIPTFQQEALNAFVAVIKDIESKRGGPL